MVFGILFLMFICFCIGYTVLRIYTKLFSKKKPIKEQINPYIWYHKMKLKNDMDYEEYLKFCAQVGEAPVDQAGFEDIRKKEEEIRNMAK